MTITSDPRRGFVEQFRHSNPCPVCGGTNGKCQRTVLGKVMCRRTDDNGYEPVNGWVWEKLTSNTSFAMWVPEDPRQLTYVPRDFFPPRKSQSRSEEQHQRLEDWLASVGSNNVIPVAGFPTHQARYQALYPRFSRETLAQLDAVFVAESVPLCHALGMPEVDGKGAVIGYNFVWPSRDKKSHGARGITVPARLAASKPDLRPPEAVYERIAVTDRNAWTIYVVEGASDVLAMAEMGLLAIGRPNNAGGVPELVEWVKTHLPRWRWDVVVLGENDLKPDGRYPGREGAIRVAHGLSDGLEIVTRWAMPPAGAKDVRDWLDQQSRRKGQPTPRSLGHELASHLAEVSHRVKPGEPLPFGPAPAPALSAEEQAAIDEAIGRMLAHACEQARADNAKEAEAEAARTIASARADLSHGPMRCCRPRPIVLHDTETGGVRVQYVRCEDFIHCRGCQCWRILRESANAAFRFQAHAEAGGQLYEMAVGVERWAAVRRRLNRMGGHYLRTHEDCAGSLYYVVTTVPHPDAIACSPQTATSTVRHLLEEYDEQARPVAASHGWKLPQADQECDRFRRLGMGNRFLTLMALRKMSEEMGCRLAMSGPSGDGSRRVVACDLVRGRWTADDRDWVASCLFAGEVLPRFGTVTFKPIGPKPAKPAPWDDIPW